MSGEGLRRRAEGLWTLEGEPIRYLGFPYEIRMTAARLGDGSLWLHAPVQCTADRRAAVEVLGPVRHLVTPNKLHHLFLGDWARHFPEATIHAPPGLSARRPDLRFDALLGDRPAPAWRDVLDQCIFGPSLFMDEVVFLHRPSRTLILGDLVENHRPTLFTGWRRAVARANRMLGPHAETPRNWRVTFYARRRTRAVAQRILSWRPERIILLHGTCVEQGAEEFLRNALAWLLGPPPHPRAAPAPEDPRP